MTKTELFIKLANPDKDGFSRWVSVSEFIGEYQDLKLGNGGSWCRASSTLARKYKIGFDRSRSSGNSIDAVRLLGINESKVFSQSIRSDIKEYYSGHKCVMLGIAGTSENTKIEIDHKDGRKTDLRVSQTSTQTIDDFQPLCKAANDAKRQICKICRETNKRWNAKNIKGNPYSYYQGDENYSNELRCEGCYQYDPVKYRKESVKKLIKEASEATSEHIFNKLYKDEN